MHLLLQAGRFGRSIVVRHHQRAYQGQRTQQALGKLLPEFYDWLVPVIGIKHGIQLTDCNSYCFRMKDWPVLTMEE